MFQQEPPQAFTSRTTPQFCQAPRLWLTK